MWWFIPKSVDYHLCDKERNEIVQRSGTQKLKPCNWAEWWPCNWQGGCLACQLAPGGGLALASTFYHCQSALLNPHPLPPRNPPPPHPHPPHEQIQLACRVSGTTTTTSQHCQLQPPILNSKPKIFHLNACKDYKGNLQTHQSPSFQTQPTCRITVWLVVIFLFLFNVHLEQRLRR